MVPTSPLLCCWPQARAKQATSQSQASHKPGTTMEILWKSYESLWTILWKSYESHMNILWKAYESPMNILWKSCENLMHILWKSYEHPVNILWKSYENPIRSKATPTNCSLYEHVHFAHRGRGCLVDPTPHPPTPSKLDQIVRGVTDPIGGATSEKIGGRNSRTVLWKHSHHRHRCIKPTHL